MYSHFTLNAVERHKRKWLLKLNEQCGDHLFLDICWRCINLVFSCFNFKSCFQHAYIHAVTYTTWRQYTGQFLLQTFCPLSKEIFDEFFCNFRNTKSMFKVIFFSDGLITKTIRGPATNWVKNNICSKILERACSYSTLLCGSNKILMFIC